jgi:50S ribosomal subunit-associated GTPase HflX
VAVNKIDLPQVKARRDELEKSFAAIATRVFFISASSGEGIPELMAAVEKLLQSEPEPAKGKKVFRPQPKP